MVSQLVAYLCILHLFFFLTKSCVSQVPGWPATHYVAKDDPERPILLHPSPDCWNYRCVLPCQVYQTQGFLHAKKELYHLSYMLSFSFLLSECAFQKVSQITPCSWAWASGTHLMQSKHSSLHSILQGSASGGVPQAPSSWISSAPLCLVPTVLQTQWPLCYSWNILPFRHPQGQTLTSFRPLALVSKSLLGHHAWAFLSSTPFVNNTSLPSTQGISASLPVCVPPL